MMYGRWSANIVILKRPVPSLTTVGILTRNPNETPQALYSRIKQHNDDNLVGKNTLQYKGAVLTADEELSPTLHCTIILHWLNVLHPSGQIK